MNDVTVNDTIITEADILTEVQYHPAETIEAAQQQAARWLVVRELLLDRAKSLNLDSEEDDDTKIKALIEHEVDTPEPDNESCRRYYENNRKRFKSPDLVEAEHILLMAAPDDLEERERAEVLALQLIEKLTAEPNRFGELARKHSACNSKDSEGRLGQVGRGDTVPEMETFLFNLEDGQLSPVPVRTRYGIHIVRTNKKIFGRDLPFEAVAEKISDYLKARSWQRAFSQYVQLLAGEACISGVEIAAADTPLVQ